MPSRQFGYVSLVPNVLFAAIGEDSSTPIIASNSDAVIANVTGNLPDDSDPSLDSTLDGISERTQYLQWLLGLSSGDYVRALYFNATFSNKLYCIHTAFVKVATPKVLSILYRIESPDGELRRVRVPLDRGYTGVNKSSPLKMFAIVPITYQFPVDLYADLQIPYKFV